MAGIPVLFPFIGDTIGGSHVSAVTLMQHLQSRGYDPVALIHEPGPLEAYLRRHAVEVLPIALPYLRQFGSGLGDVLGLAAMTIRLAFFLRRTGYRIVHVNDGRMIASWTLAGRLAGVPTVAHRRTRWTPSRLAALSLRLASRIVTISKYVRDSLPLALSRRASVVMNPFVIPAIDRIAARKRVEELTGAQGVVVAFVGTLQQQKRPQVFLHAATAIAAKFPDARFLVIGRDGGEEEQLRRMVRETALIDKVCFTGYRSDVPDLLAGCDILLAPGVGEGHGRALVEAMLVGTPVICSASGGHLEIVQHGDTGILVAEDDSGALAEAAVNQLNDAGSRERMAVRAATWARETLSGQRHAAEIAALYDELLKRQAQV